MQTGNLLLLLVVMIAGAYYMGHRRSFALARPLGGIRHLHSLPFYYAMRTAIWCAIPALVVLGVWLAFDDTLIRNMVMGSLPAASQPVDGSAANLMLNQISNVASGALSPASVSPEIAAAAEKLNSLRQLNTMAITVVVIVVAMRGTAWGWVKISPQMRARQQVEKVLQTLFMLSATIAILSATASGQHRTVSSHATIDQ